MILKIGRRHTTSVQDLSQASAIYAMLRNESGEGASTFPNGKITDGKKTYRVSYNGRVWDKEVCVFEPTYG